MALFDASSPVGVMDSGVGGLTVVLEMRKLLPRESVLYFADTGRLPYGPRPSWQVREFTRQIVEFLKDKGAKAIVIGCNTATAAALDLIEETFPGPVVGVIGPGARGAVEAAGPEGRIGLIATEGTVKSGAYDRALAQNGVKGELLKRACPEFVTLVESGLKDEEHVRKVVYESLGVFRDNPVDALILGCTHFPLLYRYISEVLPGVKLVNPAFQGVQDLARSLSEKGLLAPESNEPRFKFFTSGDETQFRENLEMILGPDSYDVEKVTLPS